MRLQLGVVPPTRHASSSSDCAHQAPLLKQHVSSLMRCLGRLLPAARSGLVHARSSSTAYTAMPRVAVVGGGLAGLMCAQELQSAGVAVHVFDMGRRGPGQLLNPLSCL